MSQFAPRWSSWTPEEATLPTDKTDKSPTAESETPIQRIDKTDKSPFGSFVSSVPGRPETFSGAEGDVPPASNEPPFDADQFAAMRVGEFARAGLVVKIHSGVLGTDVLFASDNVPDSEISDLGLAVYRAAEMRKLALWRPEPAGLVHAVKEVLGVYGATIRSVKSRRV